jgi:hypothetical protein
MWRKIWNKPWSERWFCAWSLPQSFVHLFVRKKRWKWKSTRVGHGNSDEESCEWYRKEYSSMRWCRSRFIEAESLPMYGWQEASGNNTDCRVERCYWPSYCHLQLFRIICGLAMVTAMRPFVVAGFIQEHSEPKRDSALDEYYIPKSWIFAVAPHHASTLQPSYSTSQLYSCLSKMNIHWHWDYINIIIHPTQIDSIHAEEKLDWYTKNLYGRPRLAASFLIKSTRSS